MSNRNIVETYELLPFISQNQKSFYGKARVSVNSDGSETLISYDTKIILRNKDGQLYRLWNDWSKTTGRHIYAYCGLRKKDYDKLPLLAFYN